MRACIIVFCTTAHHVPTQARNSTVPGKTYVGTRSYWNIDPATLTSTVCCVEILLITSTNVRKSTLTKSCKKTTSNHSLSQATNTRRDSVHSYLAHAINNRMTLHSSMFETTLALQTRTKLARTAFRWYRCCFPAPYADDNDSLAFCCAWN